MSGFDENNPFGDPFSDPSITSATNKPTVNGDSGLEDYNPFANNTTKPTNSIRGAANPPLAPEPAVINTSSLGPSNKSYGSPPAYTPSAATNISIDEIQRQKEELDRKEAELAAREERLRREAQTMIKENNWPPIPSFCPFTPCFYQDINVEIRVEFQKIVRLVYYLWMSYVGVLFFNLLGGLAAMIKGIEGGGGIFAFSLVSLLIFTPLSFICWFRPLYKAFRNDSSFNFMVFFFVFFCQLVFAIIWAIGIPGMHAIGILSGLLIIMDSNSTNIELAIGISFFMIGILWALMSLASLYIISKVLIIYLVINKDIDDRKEYQKRGAFNNGLITAVEWSSEGVFFSIFTFLCALVTIGYAIASFLVLIKVHSIYRSTGASMQKAQMEFTQGVMRNETVQQAATAAAAGAARQAMNQQFSSGQNGSSGLRF